MGVTILKAVFVLIIGFILLNNKVLVVGMTTAINR